MTQAAVESPISRDLGCTTTTQANSLGGQGNNESRAIPLEEILWPKVGYLSPKSHILHDTTVLSVLHRANLALAAEGERGEGVRGSF